MLCIIILGVQAFPIAYFPHEYYGGVLLDNVACSGNESMLISCVSRSSIGVHNCQHHSDARVICPGKDNDCPD